VHISDVLRAVLGPHWGLLGTAMMPMQALVPASEEKFWGVCIGNIPALLRAEELRRRPNHSA
jgi:hypothetical protein